MVRDFLSKLTENLLCAIIYQSIQHCTHDNKREPPTVAGLSHRGGDSKVMEGAAGVSVEGIWGLGGSSQYQLVAVPRAVRMLSRTGRTQWPPLWVEGGRGPWPGSRLPARGPSPINSFMCSPSKRASIRVADRKRWPRLICVCAVQILKLFFEMRNGCISSNWTGVVLLMNGRNAGVKT